MKFAFILVALVGVSVCAGAADTVPAIDGLRDEAESYRRLFAGMDVSSSITNGTRRMVEKRMDDRAQTVRFRFAPKTGNLDEIAICRDAGRVTTYTFDRQGVLAQCTDIWTNSFSGAVVDFHTNGHVKAVARFERGVFKGNTDVSEETDVAPPSETAKSVSGGQTQLPPEAGELPRLRTEAAAWHAAFMRLQVRSEGKSGPWDVMTVRDEAGARTVRYRFRAAQNVFHDVYIVHPDKGTELFVFNRGAEDGRLARYVRIGKNDADGEIIDLHASGKIKRIARIRNGRYFGTMDEYAEDGTIVRSANLNGARFRLPPQR